MLKSMTAFASGEHKHEQGTLNWELRSVNHRYLEVSLRLPEEFRSMEASLREQASDILRRGKLEAQLRFKPALQQSAELQINKELAESLIQASERLTAMMKHAATVDPLEVLKWPGVANQAETDLGPLQTASLKLFRKTLESLVNSRETEGKRLQKLLKQRCSELATLVGQVRARRPEVVENIRSKLLNRLQGLDIEIDSGRLEQELLLLAQKLDVDEELDRLESHLSEMDSIFKRKEPVGRRLDFLMQEFNREVNTLGSKSADSETTQASVDMKVLIEQMREQIQNIE